MLHFLELPLRHLMEKLDGKFTGPATSKGPIGSIITRPAKEWVKPVVQFSSVPICQEAYELLIEFRNNCNPKEFLNDEQSYFFNLSISYFFYISKVQGSNPRCIDYSILDFI